ncbi:MAG: hypothetical protein K9L86_00160 [Candidatus Omnitrophica bacterium]|nr:hypothetical protein [Candidatus Omnitrophota bacterium]
MKHKAQSFLDYAALIAIVAVSLLVMSSYVFRSIDARVGHIWADLYDIQNGVR